MKSPSAFASGDGKQKEQSSTLQAPDIPGAIVIIVIIIEGVHRQGHLVSPKTRSHYITLW
jgi:hypothetical protein